MILVDSDVFLIDLRYQRDERFGGNRAFLDRLAISGQGATTIYKEVTTFVTWNARHFHQSAPESHLSWSHAESARYPVAALLPDRLGTG